MKKSHHIIFFLSVILFIIFIYFGCKSAPVEEGKIAQAGYAVASWYGPKFHGKQTASGETYNMYDLTCAHKYLPLGTLVRITNPENRKSVMVRVNDRGPFIPGRDFDLSFGAADKLDIVNQGVSKVYYEVFETEDSGVIPTENIADTYVFYIQAGSFSEKRNAESVVAQIESLTGEEIKTQAFQKGKQTYHRVLVGPYSSRQGAETVSQTIEHNGYDTIILTVPISSVESDL